MLVFALLMFWQIAAMGMNAAYIMPSPAQVVQRLWICADRFLRRICPPQCPWWYRAHDIYSAGMALAILMDASPIAEKALYPVVIASQTIPTTALALFCPLVRLYDLE